uniref:Uncharacterized protein n=1 Tax=Noctiluca scintillans TaxID=2966 RepID=A0A7S0ZRV1_NOCSC|mmetsp:Transcript_16338/g.44344  ORF Transcript_16338/g.44344 Transcript_16338/m.44344 type:complete len:399 (+) Transcript_16338:120-1316(+)
MGSHHCAQVLHCEDPLEMRASPRDEGCTIGIGNGARNVVPPHHTDDWPCVNLFGTSQVRPMEPVELVNNQYLTGYSDNKNHIQKLSIETRCLSVDCRGNSESDPVLMQEVVDVDESDVGSHLLILEFIARTENIEAVDSRFSIVLNGSVVLASEIQMRSTFSLFHFDTHVAEPVERVTFCRHAAQGSSLLCENNVFEFDPTFGIQFNGEDISSTLRLLSTSQTREWLMRGRAMIPMHENARRGYLEAIPSQYTMEKSLEFIVSAPCKETFDVYVNGLSVVCQKDVQPGDVMTPTLVRISFAPLTCDVRSVVLHLPTTSGGGIKLDTSFGVMLGGQDCLPSVTFVSDNGTRDSSRWHSQSAEWQRLKSGTWSWPGFYHMLPYQATKKPFERLTKVERVP